MNILFVGNHFSDERNNQNVWQDLAAHLHNAGNKVITTSDKKNKILRMADILLTIWQHRNEYEVAQVDVFSGQAFVWAYLSVKLLKYFGKKVILTLHGGKLPEFSVQFQEQVTSLLHQADAVTVPSRYLLEAMASYRDDLTLIPNAIDISLYPYTSRASPSSTLIWLRAFHEIYHPELAIYVFHLLHTDFPTSRLIMIGPDKGDGSLQKTLSLTAELKLEDYVEINGKVPKSEVPDWLNKGDIFINTTNYDNTPISVIEAMACGSCIVSTNVGGLPYLLEHEKDALLVPANDPVAMASAVLRILN